MTCSRGGKWETSVVLSSVLEQVLLYNQLILYYLSLQLPQKTAVC